MKKSLILLVIFLFLSLSNERNFINASESGSLGAGVIIGEPTGLSFKYWLDGSNKNAIDGAIAWSIGNDKLFQIHTDYLFHNYRIFKIKRGKLGFYFGGGARIKIKNDNYNDDNKGNDDSTIGVRIPLGLDYIFEDIPIDIFLEIVPVMDLLPATDFGLNASIGARYYF